MKLTTDYDMMTSELRRLNYKRRESQLLEELECFHPVIEKVSRAISDWQSERDWYFQTDRAFRTLDAVATELNKEGHREAASYLLRIIGSHIPKPRSADSKPEEPQRLSQLYF